MSESERLFAGQGAQDFFIHSLVSCFIDQQKNNEIVHINVLFVHLISECQKLFRDGVPKTTFFTVNFHLKLLRIRKVQCNGFYIGLRNLCNLPKKNHALRCKLFRLRASAQELQKNEQSQAPTSRGDTIALMCCYPKYHTHTYKQ